jgi:hypothetical protein
MQTNPLPEIDESDLKAVRDFLTSFRDEERQARVARRPLVMRGNTVVRNGITRARTRSVPRTGA